MIASCRERLLYADDIALLASTKESLRDKLNEMNEIFLKHGLFISAQKTEWMVFNESFQEDSITISDGKEFKRVDEFIYLGSVFTSDCKSDKDIERRLKLANAAASGINSLLWSPRISRIKKVRLIFCFVYPVLSYGCETWAINAMYKQKLNVQWMKWMRRCYGCTIFDKIRNEKILKKLFPDDEAKQNNMMGIISERQDRYIGHVLIAPWPINAQRQGAGVFPA